MDPANSLSVAAIIGLLEPSNPPNRGESHGSGTIAGSKSVFRTGVAAARMVQSAMHKGYGQFCPIAKASEILANRWTPLIMRELMAGVHSFNNIHRGVPLISRAVLAARLRELEHHGIIERRPRPDRNGHDYRLTVAGDAFRPIIAALGAWGLAHARDRIQPADLDPT